MISIKKRFLIGALAMCTALPIVAQPRHHQGMAGNRLAFLSGYLGLSDAQKEQAKAIFDESSAAAKPLAQELAGARTALHQAAKDGQSDAQLDQLAATVGNLHGQIAGVHAKASAKFYALLSPEQKTKYDQRKPGRRGGPGRWAPQA